MRFVAKSIRLLCTGGSLGKSTVPRREPGDKLKIRFPFSYSLSLHPCLSICLSVSLSACLPAFLSLPLPPALSPFPNYLSLPLCLSTSVSLEFSPEEEQLKQGNKCQESPVFRLDGIHMHICVEPRKPKTASIQKHLCHILPPFQCHCFSL